MIIFLTMALQLHQPLPVHTVPYSRSPVAIIEPRIDGVDRFRKFTKKGKNP